MTNAGERESDQYLILDSEFLSEKTAPYRTAAAPSDKNSEFGIESLVRSCFQAPTRPSLIHIATASFYLQRLSSEDPSVCPTPAVVPVFSPAAAAFGSVPAAAAAVVAAAAASRPMDRGYRRSRPVLVSRAVSGQRCRSSVQPDR